MPRLLVRARLRPFAALVGTGVGHAGLAALTAAAMPVLLTPGPVWIRVSAALGLLGGALALGWLRQVERVQAERLGQDYVQEIRTRLVAGALSGRGPSLGVTITRASNDLNSVRNWIALGIAPLAVAVPVVLGTMAALWALAPVLVVPVVITLGALVLALLCLAPATYARSREVRRRRGRLAGHLADTLAAADAIRAAGGVNRETRTVTDLGERVRTAAVDRAEAAGWVRGAAVACSSAALVGVAVSGVLAGSDTTTVATALTVVGILGGSISDLGRVVEYRQSYRAARRVLEPALAGATPSGGALSAEAQEPAHRHGEDGLRVIGLHVDGVPVPDLAVPAVSRVHVVGSADRVRAVLRVLGGLERPAQGTVRLAGRDLAEIPPEERRRLVGLAAPELALERGTVARAVRYRDPSLTDPVEPALAAVGLAARTSELPKGPRTRLRAGGEPLNPADRALLHLARATWGSPSLVLVDQVDRHVDAARRRYVRERLAACAAVVVAAADDPWTLGAAPVRWDVGHS
ncbi:ABC transporter transmembrane domain-containing protein [Nonomuraea polychroma]|uniref:ABC transporter transmembrane domain-containing protein n=1 Tax=Nonomuraea polychroma TaxID=46176 RepID=UPI003D91476D